MGCFEDPEMPTNEELGMKLRTHLAAAMVKEYLTRVRLRFCLVERQRLKAKVLATRREEKEGKMT